MARNEDDELLLPADVQLVPVQSLASRVRDRLRCEDGDYVVSRALGRARAVVIERAAADLLKLFRTPKRLDEAVRAHCVRTASDPRQILEDAYPLVRRLAAMNILEPGTTWGAWKIVRAVQVLEDTEVYEARDEAGTSVAVKVLRHSAHPRFVEALRREREILEHLGGWPAPILVDFGASQGRPYLVLQWLEGTDSLTTSNRIRAGGGSVAREHQLACCAGIIEAYQALHARGVIHADVHPRNIIVDSAGAVHLIDFGTSRLIDPASTFAAPPREGIGYFFEPEFARALVQGDRVPAATVRGEIYALAALVYLLMTGSHYLEFYPDREVFLRQILEDTPFSFTRRGCEPWLPVEAVLRRALSKDPEGRFASAGELGEALRAAGTGGAPNERVESAIRAPATPGPLESLSARVFARLQPGGDLFEHGIADAPTASINYGAAGIAYAMYRAASLSGDAALLALADTWSRRATRDAADESAFFSARLEITPTIVGAASLYHTAVGLHLVEALVAHARWDTTSLRGALGQFAAAARRPCPNPDLALGRSGALLGCALLRETLPEHELVDTALLDALGEDLATKLWGQLETYPPIDSCKEYPSLGVAHGWAGLLFAQMRWTQSRGGLLPSRMRGRLDQLAACSQVVGRGRRWPRRLFTGARERDVQLGWCNGPSGYIHLYVLAHQMFHDARYLELAELAAWATWESPESQGNLCCGLTGRAYGLLALSRATGQSRWVDLARRLGERAELASHRGNPAHSLFKGELGPALLALDLRQPERSCLPLFDSERWPRRRMS
jgi:serine/threonine-protein kinase